MRLVRGRLGNRSNETAKTPELEKGKLKNKGVMLPRKE